MHHNHILRLGPLLGKANIVQGHIALEFKSPLDSGRFNLFLLS